MNNELYSIGEIGCYTHPDCLNVKGNNADVEDFVTIEYDHGHYCCNNIRVQPINRVTKVLSTMKKYNLSPEEMETIQDAIIEKIDGKSCGLCM